MPFSFNVSAISYVICPPNNIYPNAEKNKNKMINAENKSSK